MSEMTAVVYDNDFQLAEIMLGCPLVPMPPEQGSAIELDRLHHAAYSSVVGQLTILASAADGNPNWFLDTAIVNMVRDDHARQRKYLRMHAGLQAGRDTLEAVIQSDMRDYQQQTFNQIVDYIASNDHTASNSAGASIVLPTGSGKGRIIVRTVEAMKSQEEPKEPVRVLIAAPTNVVIAELLGEKDGDGFAGLTPDINVGVINTDNKDTEADVVLTTRTSLVKMLETDPAYLRNFTAVILDESHRFLSNKTRAVLGAMDIPIIGFTATDAYSQKLNVAKLLPDELQRRSALEMIDSGWLSPVQQWVYKPMK